MDTEKMIDKINQLNEHIDGSTYKMAMCLLAIREYEGVNFMENFLKKILEEYDPLLRYEIESRVRRAMNLQ